MDCIFCKIIRGEIPSSKILENERFLAFKDIHPAAEKHILLIPKKHIASLNELSAGDAGLYGEMLLLAAQIARQEQIDQSGYRVVFNCGRDAGMEVSHLHLRILGGQKLGRMC